VTTTPTPVFEALPVTVIGSKTTTLRVREYLTQQRVQFAFDEKPKKDVLVVVGQEKLRNPSEERLAQELGIKYALPSDHVPGMIVDKERGARCTTCRFFAPPSKCSNKLFIEAGWPETKWGPAKPAGSEVIPHAPDAYCSDWYEPSKLQAMSKANDCVGIHTHTPVNVPEVIRSSVSSASEGEAREYIAVDSRGRTVWGPGKDYSEAKKNADRSGGVVKWVSGEVAAEDIFARSIRWNFDGHVYQGTGRKGDYLIVPTGKIGAAGPRFAIYVVRVDAFGGINKRQIGDAPTHRYAMEYADKYDLDELGPDTRPEPHPAAAEAREWVPVIYEGKSWPAPETLAQESKQTAATSGDCLPWVRVTRDPERYEACLAKARKIGPIDNAHKVYDLLAPALEKEDVEVLVVVLLDVRRQLRGVSEVHRGQRSRVSVGVSDVMRIVIATGAEGFVCVHQHPSGNAGPSEADIELTKSINDACQPFGKDITFLGHVVIGVGQFTEISPEGKASKVHKV
jgi:hypothetical protein